MPKPTVRLTRRLSKLYTLRDAVDVQIDNEEQVLRKAWHRLPAPKERDPSGGRKARAARAAKIRAWWARDHPPLGRRGFIPFAITDAYDEAHPKPQQAPPTEGEPS